MICKCETTGKTYYKWLIADCFWPEVTTPGHYVSHEAICVLNASKEDAEIKITLFFESAEPMTGFGCVCPAQRTRHIRMDKLLNVNGEHVPMGVPYAAEVTSNVDLGVQYSRLDTTQANMSLMTTSL